MAHRPDTSRLADDLSRAIEQACQTRDPSALIRLTTSDAVWRDNDAVHVGREEIWSALTANWGNSLHCALKQDVDSCDARNVVIRFQSEWQHSIRGGWYCTSGELRLSLDDRSHISTIESRHSTSPISASGRRMAIATAATPETST